MASAIISQPRARTSDFCCYNQRRARAAKTDDCCGDYARTDDGLCCNPPAILLEPALTIATTTVSILLELAMVVAAISHVMCWNRVYSCWNRTHPRR